jgi:hypothetical protein
MSFSSPLDHPNLVVVHFNPYAGGKFWINCLAHHSAAMPLISNLHDRHRAMFDLEDDLKQRLKLELINKTLPPPDELHQWCQYELGHFEMWGGSLEDLLQPNGSQLIDTKALKLLDQYKCFTINHGGLPWHQVQAKLPNAKHIFLINSEQFQRQAAALKDSTFVPGYTPLPEKISDVFYVDVDNTWLDSNITKSCVGQCWQWMGLNPEPGYPLSLYIENYFKLHR